MKIAFAIAALVLALQQQTFYSAQAKPKPVPRHTPQALPAGYLYNGCSTTPSNAHGAKGCTHRPMPRTSAHPALHHT